MPSLTPHPKPYRAHLFRLQSSKCPSGVSHLYKASNRHAKPGFGQVLNHKRNGGLNPRDAGGEAKPISPRGREGGPKSLNQSNNGLGVRDTCIAHTFFACRVRSVPRVSRTCTRPATVMQSLGLGRS